MLLPSMSFGFNGEAGTAAILFVIAWQRKSPVNIEIPTNKEFLIKVTANALENNFIIGASVAVDILFVFTNTRKMIELT